MENFILDILKSLVSPAIVSVIVNILIFRYNNKKLSLNEAPDVFAKQIKTLEKFQNLNQGLRHDTYYIITINSYFDEVKREERISTEVKNIKSQDINIKQNMLYIHMKNDYIDGAEIKILDANGREINLDSQECQYISKGQSLGVFFDFYKRPIKIYVVGKQIRFEYDIYIAEGSVKANISKVKKNN